MFNNAPSKKSILKVLKKKGKCIDEISLLDTVDIKIYSFKSTYFQIIILNEDQILSVKDIKKHEDLDPYLETFSIDDLY
jgi:hypothetical protein